MSWEPQLDRERAQEVVGWLSKRPVVYDASESELPSHARLGVSDIRKFLHVEMQRGGIAHELGDCLRAMREACVAFAAIPHDDDDPQGVEQALTTLREAFGRSIAVVAVRHGISAAAGRALEPGEAGQLVGMGGLYQPPQPMPLTGTGAVDRQRGSWTLRTARRPRRWSCSSPQTTLRAG